MAAPEWWSDYVEAAIEGRRVHFDFPRMVGKQSAARFLMEQKVLNGEHVHRVSTDGNTYCEGGDPECPLFGIQLREAMTAWQK